MSKTQFPVSQYGPILSASAPVIYNGTPTVQQHYKDGSIAIEPFNPGKRHKIPVRLNGHNHKSTVVSVALLSATVARVLFADGRFELWS
jgi:hypothetical protein